MIDHSKIKISDFNYHLPEDKIAKYPLENRDSSKLLYWDNGIIKDQKFSDIAELLPKHSLLIFNNTKVIQARMFFQKETGARIEIFLLEPNLPADYLLNFQHTSKCSWKCLIGNSKKWKTGKIKSEIEINGKNIDVKAERISTSNHDQLVEFSWDDNTVTFADILESAGNIPIPPYLNRNTEESDLERYQTVYSKIKGSVAAPTAGLHFTDNIFEHLKAKEHKRLELTLHVGAGTFQPVKSDTIDDHEMHTEHIEITNDLIDELIQNQNPVIAVGTTSIRSLESLYWIGIKILQNENIDEKDLKIGQHFAYETHASFSTTEALKAIKAYLQKRNIEILKTSTQIIIVPGYQFKVIDGMVTNFHQPQSTLLLLISAYVGNDWKRIYSHAKENNYRFLSYGDSNLYVKNKT